MTLPPPPSRAGPDRPSRARWPIASRTGNALLLLFLVAVSYGPALTGGFLWDDHGHLTRPDLQSFSGLGRIWFEVGATQQYYPLLHTAFWLEHQLWGEAPLGYHVVSLLAHTTAAFLFGTLLRRLQVPGAWLAAVLFALHPVCVESVAWISEQKNTLSAVLYLAGAHLYLRFHDTRRWQHHAVATVVFVLAVATKTVTATLPAALLVLAWWRYGRIVGRRDVAPLLPWLVLGIGAGLLTAWFEQTIIGAQGADFELGLLGRLLLAGRVVWFYLGKLLWPHPLIFIYPRWEIDPRIWWQYLPLLSAVLALAGLAWLALRRGRRAPLTIALLYGGTLVPVLGLLNIYPFIYSFVADHFQYHASFAVFAGLAAGLAGLAQRFSPPLASRVVTGLLIVVLGFLTWRQSHMYRDVFTLYHTILAQNPRAWMAHTNLGIALVDSGDAVAALPHYREALRLRPAYAEGENNLGFALSELGRFDEALPHLRRAIELNPHYPQARNNLAVALIATGQIDQGLAVFRETLELYPIDGDAHFNVGLTLARAGRTEEALGYFQQAVRLNPDDAKYVLHEGMALMFNRRFDEAVVRFRRAIALAPDDATARYTFGRALFDHRRYPEAIVELRAAVRLDRTAADAHLTLAAALEATGQFAEAERHRAEGRRLQGPPTR